MRTHCIQLKNIAVVLKQNIGYICAVLSWGLAIWIFGVLKYQVYGGNFDIGLLFLSVYPPVFLLSALLFGESSRVRSPGWKKVGTVFGSTVLAASILFILWFMIFRNPYLVRGYQFFAVLIVWGIASLFPSAKHWLKRNGKKDSAWLVSLFFVILIFTALLYCIIAHPITVKEGQRLVAESGYREVEYVDSINNTVFLHMAFDGSESFLSKHEDAMGFYLYRGKRSGENYGIAVSLVGRRIVGETAAENNNALFYYFRNLPE